MNKKCYYCGIELTGNQDSLEHIIPDALGGKAIKSKGLLCISCNNKLGRSLDSELYKQLKTYAYLLDVEKDKKSSNQILSGYEKNGEEYLIGKGLEPLVVYRCKLLDKSGKFLHELKASGYTELEARGNMRKQLKNHKKTREEIDKILASAVEVERKELPTVYFSNNRESKFENVFGGKVFFQAYCKIALNYYFYKGGTKYYVQKIIDYLKNNNDVRPAIFFYPTTRNRLNRKLLPKEISHLLYLRGDKDKNILYCYIELFSTHNVLVILNCDYQGKDMKHTFCYNLITKKEIPKEINIGFSKIHCIDYPKLDKYHKESYNKVHEQLDTRFREIIEDLQI